MFDEEKAKKSNKFYEPSYCRCLKYFAIPALIGFILLLILVNVNFSADIGKAVTAASTESTGVSTKDIQTDAGYTQETHTVTEILTIEEVHTYRTKPVTSTELFTTEKPQVTESVTKTRLQTTKKTTNANSVTTTELLISSLQTEALRTDMAVPIAQNSKNQNLCLKEAITGAAYCMSDSSDKCLVNCTDGNLKFLDKDLPDFNLLCNNNLHLTLDKCLFTSGTMTASDFPNYYYNFHLRVLVIIKGNLVAISDGAFKTTAIKKLQELSINSTALSELNETTFDGLQYLEVLKWLNLPCSTIFKGTNFLQPVAGTIKEVLLCQLSAGDVYDPFSWLDGKKSFPLLTYVDLSNNNFGDMLNAKTFGNLIAVRELILTNSSITNIAKDTFKNILGTLEYLDLSLNRLHTLDVSALATKATLRVELHGNDWNCICENEQLIVAIKAKTFSSTIEPRCVAPAEWESTPITEVILNCDAEMPPTTSKPVETSPTPETEEPPVTERPPDKPTPPGTTAPPVTQEPPDLPTPPGTEKSPVPTKPPPPPPITPLKTPAPLITPPSTPATVTETNESNKTPNNDNSTILPTPTPPSPPSITYAQLQCQSNTPPNSYFNVTIRHYDARFTVNSDTSTSAVLLIKSDMKRLTLIYFIANNYTVSSAEKVPSEKISTETRSLKVDCRCARTTTSFTVIHVQGLLSNQSYVFCLVPEIERTVSPLNCQAHFIGVQATTNGLAWLLTNDQAWCIILLIFGILLAVALGLLTIYWLLRWRPIWLRGCKRIIRAAATSNEVFLLPKQEKRATAEDSTYNMSTCLDFESYDYMQFFKDIQDARPRRRPHSVQASLVPTERAPAVPQTSECYMQFYRDQQSVKVCRRPAILKVYTIPEEPAPAVPQQQSRTTSMQSTLPADDLIEQCLKMEEEEDDDGIYQSIAYYELPF